MRYLPNLGGRVYSGCENFFGECMPFKCFIAFLLTSFANILEGGYTFIPLTPLCASMNTTTVEAA